MTAGTRRNPRCSTLPNTQGRRKTIYRESGLACANYPAYPAVGTEYSAVGARVVAWFSCGAASAIASKLARPDVIAYCDTGAEHPDNARFRADCAAWFGRDITVLRSATYEDTWAVWERRRYLSGIAGAPCTHELKVKPRLAFQRPDDVHVFGYTADARDVARGEALAEHYPDLSLRYPLIERGLTKAACLDMIGRAGIEPPLTYAMGFPNANCLPCVKATSPAYWALVRREFPAEFERMATLSRRLGVKLTRLRGARAYIDTIPADHPVTQPIAPDCDLLCSLVEQDMHA